LHIPRYSIVLPCDVTSGLSCQNFFSSFSITSFTTLGSTWDILRSSTCHIIVHCFPLITLFVTHLSYSFILKPHSIRVSKSSHQNRSAACSVPYNAFFSFTYNISFPHLFSQMYFLYRLGSSFTTNLAIVPSNSICTSSSMSACRKTPGISVTTTCLHSLAYIAHDIIIALSNTVGELVSTFVVYSH